MVLPKLSGKYEATMIDVIGRICILYLVNTCIEISRKEPDPSCI